jgi:Na+/H+-dicarboxylate symporter
MRSPVDDQDSIPDVFATVANVTGDMGVAAMVADATPEGRG